MGATPQVADWNEDGKKDLLVGDRAGYVTLFTNNGSDASPVLTQTGHIKAGSYDIDVGNNSCPVVMDWDNDGKKDLIIGTNSGTVRVYTNIGTNDNPSFNNFTYILADGSIINHYRSSPEVADMNGDGKKDLLVGDHYGAVYYYENMGTDASPVFIQGIRLKAGSYNLDVGEGAIIDVADWDEDGDLDLIVGEDNAVMNLFRNTSSTAVDEPDILLPRRLTLYQNHPNPFNMETVFSFQLPEAGQVQLTIFDITGKQTRSLFNGPAFAGYHQISWNGVNDQGEPVPSGVYVYQLQSNGIVQSRKLIVEK